MGISPLVDFAFKMTLGSSEHTRVTVHFLNAILAGEDFHRFLLRHFGQLKRQALRQSYW